MCLLPNPLLPKGNILKRFLPTCACSTSTTLLPTIDMFDNTLLCLSIQDQQTLSPFRFDGGPLKVQQHGYRIKTSGFDLFTKSTSVWDQIQSISTPNRRRLLEQAYSHLMSRNDCHYSHFIELHNSHSLQDKYTFNETFRLPFVETGIWPILYHRDQFCESSILQSDNSRHSKRQFIHKCLSNILDFSSLFDLLHFQYDRWAFEIITGTIESGKKFGCSAATLLDSKPICHTYWRWKHFLLLDTVERLGFPTLFVTISADKWCMNKPFWVQDRYQHHGLAQTQDSFAESFQIIHSLQQLVCGLFAGSTHSKWTSHLLSNHKHKTRSNILAFFYRLEFQRRGTPHIHALFWLKNIKAINLKPFTADIPNNNLALAHHIRHTQASNKPTNPRHLSPNPTHITDDNIFIFNQSSLGSQHNIRPYVDCINYAYGSHVDVQSTDGYGLLLQYVSSYITKLHDDCTGNALHDIDVDARNAAFRFVVSHHPTAPQMWLLLSNFKYCHHSGLTKQLTVPRFVDCQDNNITKQYESRPSTAKQMSLLQLHRTHVTSSTDCHMNKGNREASVACKMVAPSKSEFLFQYTFLHVPFDSYNDFLPANLEDVPDVLQSFAVAMHNHPQLWSSDDEISSICRIRGFRNHKILTFLSFVHSLADTYHLWHTNSINAENLAFTSILQHIPYDLNEHQCYFLSAVTHRMDFLMQCPNPVQHFQHHELPIYLISGMHGTGKTTALRAAIHRFATMQLRVLVVCPTGFLATTYKAEFGDNIAADTVHAAFHIPVNSTTPPATNWNLSQYHAIFIDEISMISGRNSQHIFETLNSLPIFPLVVLCGDQMQLQPFQTNSSGSSLLPSFFENHSFLSLATHFLLTIQHRCADERLNSFLKQIRHFHITNRQLQKSLRSISYVNSDEEVTSQTIITAYNTHPNTTFLTYSRTSSHNINCELIEYIFGNSPPMLNAVLASNLDQANPFSKT